MKHLFLFLLFLLPVLLSAQDPLPANPRKLRLGYQTDGEGIVLYGSGVPSYTPTRYRSAFHYMDTTNNIYYQYNRIEAKWDTILAGAGAVADGVSVDNSTWSKIGGTDVQQALTKTDSVLNNITIDGSQIQNKFEATTTTLTVSADSIAEKQRYVVNVKNATVQNTKVQLPQVQSTLTGRQVIVADSSLTGAATFVTVDTSGGTPLRLKVGDQYADKYYLDRGEVAVFSYTDSTVTIQPSSFRRAFSTPLEVLQARFLENDEFRYKAGRYKVQKSALSGATVDSVFVIPVNEKAPYGENLIPNSENFLPGLATQGRWLANASNINVSRSSGPTTLLNVGADNRAFWAWSKTSTTTQTIQSRIDFNDQSVKFQAGEKVTASFYIRVNSNGLSNGAGVASTSLTGASAVGPALVADTTSFGWTKYEHTFEIVTPTATFPTFTISFSFPDAPNDTIYVDRAQLERSPSPSPYKATATTDPSVWAFAGETSYALIQPVNGLIELEGIARNQYETDDAFVAAAFDYCVLLEDCKGVKMYDGQVITNTINVPEEYRLTGGEDGADIILDLNDSTKAAIVLENTNADSYGVRHLVDGFSVTAISRAESFIAMGATSGGVIKNITFPEADSLDYVIQVGDNALVGAVDSKIENVEINNSQVSNIYYENCGNNHSIIRSRLGRSALGIFATRVASLNISDCVVEQNSVGALEIQEGNIIAITENSYFESNPSTSSAPSFILDDVKKFIFSESRVSSGSRFQFKATGSAEFINSDLFQFAVEKERASTLVSVEKCYINDDALARLKAQAELDVNITEKDNIEYDLELGQRLGLQSRQDLRESRIRDGFVSSSVISDTTTLDGIFLTAYKENLFTYSDSVGAEGTVDNVTFQNNTYPDPFGGMTADLVIGAAGASGARATTARTLSEVIPAGSSVTVSFYVRDISSTPDDNDEAIDLVLKQSGGTSILGRRVLVSQVPSGAWIRQVYTIDSLSAALGRVEIEYEKIHEGDSLAVAAFQLNVGPIPRKYVATTSAAVQDSSITIPSSGPVTIDSLDNRAFDGGELYILPNDPDTLDFSAAGGLFDQIQDMTTGTLDNFTSSGDTLYYTGSVTRPFTVNFTATLEADTGTQELQMRITKNAASLDKCTVSKDYSTSGVEVQITGTCRVDLSENDAIALEVSPTQNTSQLIVRRANINLH